MNNLKYFLIPFLFLSTQIQAQDDDLTSAPTDTTMFKGDKWYDKFQIRGYGQVRYNRLLETNPSLRCDQCDRSWGENGGFFLRRARVIIFGQVHKQVYFYIQPDFASTAGGSQNIAQIRDIYFDVGIDAANEFRFRIGQSKVPFGFENLQSSQNRLPLDRNDGINSAFSNERDIGVFFYWLLKKFENDLVCWFVRDTKAAETTACLDLACSMAKRQISSNEMMMCTWWHDLHILLK